jgi:hypothetical protein
MNGRRTRWLSKQASAHPVYGIPHGILPLPTNTNRNSIAERLLNQWFLPYQAAGLGAGGNGGRQVGNNEHTNATSAT